MTSAVLRQQLARLSAAYRRRFSLDLRQVVERFDIPRSGVLHVGGNRGQEALAYHGLGFERVVWIEGMPTYFAALSEAIRPFPEQSALQMFASDVDGEPVVLRVANTEGASTLLTPRTDFVGIEFVDEQRYKARRLDKALPEAGISLKGMSLLVLDVEGYEPRVLRGLGDQLEHFNWVLCEISLVPNYIGGPTVVDIDRLLERCGFRRRRSWLGRISGDALYERVTSISMSQLLTHRLTAIGFYALSKMGVLSLKTRAREILDRTARQ